MLLQNIEISLYYIWFTLHFFINKLVLKITWLLEHLYAYLINAC